MPPLTAGKPTLYEQLTALPEELTGEIIHGQLRTQPRPAWPHSLACSRLGADIEGPYGRGRAGGPGGWWIIDEPEVHFVLDAEVTVPDIAGWRRERMPAPPQGHKIQVVPAWKPATFTRRKTAWSRSCCRRCTRAEWRWRSWTAASAGPSRPACSTCRAKCPTPQPNGAAKWIDRRCRSAIGADSPTTTTGS